MLPKTQTVLALLLVVGQARAQARPRAGDGAPAPRQARGALSAPKGASEPLGGAQGFPPDREN